MTRSFFLKDLFLKENFINKLNIRKNLFLKNVKSIKSANNYEEILDIFIGSDQVPNKLTYFKVEENSMGSDH